MILKSIRHYIPVLSYIAFTVFISRFLFLNKFGLYEDDYYNIPPYLNIPAGDLLELIKLNLTNWLQGRPLSFLPYIFSLTGFSVAGIPGLYLISFLINTINGFLVYLILKNIISEPHVFALSGALMFCLFPSDTSRTLLIHSYLYQMSVMFFLIAAYLYLKNYKLISYFIVLLCLFSFESMFILFFAVPFLQKIKPPGFKKKYYIHILVLVSFLFLSFLYRKFTGETRVEEFTGNIADYIFKSAVSFFTGPFVNLYLLLRAPVATMKNIDLISFSLITVFLLLTIFILWNIKSVGSDERRTEVINFGSGKLKFQFNCTSSERLKECIKLIPISLLFISLGYVLSFTHYPPTAVTGRLTSVHIPAAFGVSLLFALCVTSFSNILTGERQKVIWAGIVSFYISVLVGYGLVIQSDFVKSWENQRNFWTRVIELCPDLNDNTLILVNNSNRKLPSTVYILSNSWADPVVLQRIFRFPVGWKNPPRLFVLNSDLEKRAIIENDTLKWKVPEYTFFSAYEPIRDSTLIFLNTDENGFMSRINSNTMKIKLKDVILKSTDQSEIFIPEKTLIYNLLIKN